MRTEVRTTPAAARPEGSDGVTRPGVRAPAVQCIGVFWPDVLPMPVQEDNFDFHRDGGRVDRVRNGTSGGLFALPRSGASEHVAQGWKQVVRSPDMRRQQVVAGCVNARERETL